MKALKFGTFGESQVGKTCILKRYFNDRFDPEEGTSINPETYQKTIEENMKQYLIKFWDTSGQERYRSLTHQYFSGLKGLFLVYDITNRDTFEKIQDWIENGKGEIDENTAIIILGNKSDLKEMRMVQEKEGEELAKQYNLDFFETSAKDGNGIEKAMKRLFSKAIELVSKEQPETVRGDSLNEKTEEKKKSKCC